MEIKKERLIYIDQMKGIAIFIVVMGHFIQNNTIESKHNTLFGIIYSFHMPLFMFISGYVAFKTITKKDLISYSGFLKKKAVSILIPFFSWPLIVIPYFFNTEYHNNPLDTLIGLVKSPAGGLWFLWFLFFLYLLYTLFLWISLRINKSQSVVFDVFLCVILLLPILGFRFLHFVDYIDSFILYYLFFFMGVFISKYENLKLFLLNQYTFSISFILMMVLSRLYDFNGISNLNLLLKLMLSIFAILTFYYIIVKIKWNERIDGYFRLIGRNSLVIYVTHFSMIYILPTSQLLPSLNILILMLVTIFFSILIVAACLVIMKIVELSKLLNFILYGRLDRTPKVAKNQ